MVTFTFTSYLCPGDDVKYHSSSSSSSPLCGRIIAMTENTFSTKQYISSRDVDDIPPSPFECLKLTEVYSSSSVEIVDKQNIVDILFVFSEVEICSHAISVAGMGNVIWIRYQQVQDTEILRIDNWDSFRTTFPLSFPSFIFQGILTIRHAIVHELNVGRMTQRPTSLIKLSMQKIVYEYLKTSLSIHATIIRRKGFRCIKTTYHDLSKRTKRIPVFIECVKIASPEGLSSLSKVLGLLCLKGSKTKHPKQSQSYRQSIQYGTVLNVLDSVKFAYIDALHLMVVNVRFSRCTAS